MTRVSSRAKIKNRPVNRPPHKSDNGFPLLAFALGRVSALPLIGRVRMFGAWLFLSTLFVSTTLAKRRKCLPPLPGIPARRSSTPARTPPLAKQDRASPVSFRPPIPAARNAPSPEVDSTPRLPRAKYRATQLTACRSGSDLLGPRMIR